MVKLRGRAGVRQSRCGARIVSLATATAMLVVASLAQARDLAYVGHGSISGMGVSVVDVATGAVVATIPVVGSSGHRYGRVGAVVASRDVQRIYVGLSRVVGAGAVLVIDTTLDEIVDTIELDGPVDDLAFSADESSLLVMSVDSFGAYTTTISTIDLATAQVSSFLTLSGRGIGIAAAPDGATIFVTLGPRFVAIDVASEQIDEVDLSLPPYAFEGGSLLLSAAGDVAYVGGALGVSIVDTVAVELMGRVDLGRSASHLAISPNGEFVYAVSDYRFGLFVIDTATNTLSDRFEFGSTGNALALSPSGSQAHVAINSSGVVLTLDLVSGDVVARSQIHGRVSAIATGSVVRPPHCGDGSRDPGETCDDGNRFGGDGCSKTCSMEAGLSFALDTPESSIREYSALRVVSGSLAGHMTMRVGDPNAQGVRPLAIRAADFSLLPIALPGIGCMCVRPSAMPGMPPGIVGEGMLGCGDTGLEGTDIATQRDHNIDDEDPYCRTGELPPLLRGRHDATNRCMGQPGLERSGTGAQGASSIRLALATHFVPDGGTCEVDVEKMDKGPDGVPCTQDDPWFDLGAALEVFLTTGRATGRVLDADDVDGLVLEAFAEGDLFDCDALGSTDPSVPPPHLVGARPNTSFRIVRWPIRPDLEPLEPNGDDTVTVLSLVLRAVSNECPGDCDMDARVDIGELIRAVGLSLSSEQVDGCSALDRNATGRIEIGEVVAAVHAALHGCG